MKMPHKIPGFNTLNVGLVPSLDVGGIRKFTTAWTVARFRHILAFEVLSVTVTFREAHPGKVCWGIVRTPQGTCPVLFGNGWVRIADQQFPVGKRFTFGPKGSAALARAVTDEMSYYVTRDKIPGAAKGRVTT